MNAFRGFITGAVLGGVCWSAIGLTFIYFSKPADTWECHTDMECELEAQRKGL